MYFGSNFGYNKAFGSNLYGGYNGCGGYGGYSGYGGYGHGGYGYGGYYPSSYGYSNVHYSNKNLSLRPWGVDSSSSSYDNSRFYRASQDEVTATDIPADDFQALSVDDSASYAALDASSVSYTPDATGLESSDYAATIF